MNDLINTASKIAPNRPIQPKKNTDTGNTTSSQTNAPSIPVKLTGLVFSLISMTIPPSCYRPKKNTPMPE